ncbi:hypothetical protein NG895_16490 [Aeoliella sp. ICT_H6.2]|uniref:Uncharacterized protein n=1 Tax=Aeoliella straminimaris TaxID=2954799 RepID=A0A9X2FI29_9BACT|nr:hypothetical protein [Aeoliella straminimaris]MCO6045511.1 hypothetical protein [Aeoliella straminimaris]
MQPFSVVCETCGAKLKVRDKAIVGQIHACPKCESMVLVAVPAAAASPPPMVPPKAAEAAPPSDGTIAPSDFATEIDDLLQPPAPAEEPVSPPAAEVTAAEATQPPTEAATAAEPPADAAATEPAIPSDAVVAGSGPSRTAFWVWSIAGSAAFFALGLLAAAWWSRGDEQPQAPQVASRTESTPPGGETEPTPAEPSGEQVAVNKPAIEPENQPDETPAVEPADETPEVEPPAFEPLPDLPPVDDQPAAEPAEAGSPPKKVNLDPLDPLAIDSANLDLLLIPDVDTNVTAEAPIEFGPEEADDTEELEVDLPEQKNIRFEPGTASRGPSYAEPLAAGELASRLEMKLPGVTWRNTPLVVALRELEQLSGAPITVRPAHLQMAGVTAMHKVSLAEENATVRQLATGLAKAAHLRAETTPQGLVLVRAGTDKWHPVGSPQYDVSDLVSSAEEAGALGDLLQRVVSPESWQQADAKLAVDGAAFKIHQQLGVHYDILKFIERLRMARGLPTRSRYPKSLLSIEPRLATMKKQLARPTTFAFVDWTPLADVFDYWHETSGLTMVADWQRLADNDLRPLATMAGSVDNVAFSQALDTCLTPLDMAWTPTDGSTLQLTTVDAANNSSWVEFYPGADADKLRERIESTVEPQRLQQFVLQADPSGKFVLVYGNRYVHQAALK